MPALSVIAETPAGLAAAEAWRWWTGEMLGMLPERFRPDRPSSPSATIRPSRGKVEIEIVRDGIGQLFADPTSLEAMTAEGWAELAALIEGSRARIVLASPDAFVTRITLPKAALKRLKPAVRLQLPQISPLDPALLHWGVSAQESGPDRIEVQVAMARRSRIEEIGDLFEANGIAPPPIFAEAPSGPIALAPRRGLGGSGKGLLARPGLVAALLLASIPVTTMVGATLLRASAESGVERLQKGAAPRLKAEAEARRSEALRRDLRPLVTRPGVSATLEELAARLPLTDHLKSIAQGEDRILHFTVEAADAEAAEAALAGSRILPNAYASDVATAANGKLLLTFRTSAR